MTFHLDSVWLTHVLLVAVRLGALFVMAPVFGGIAMPTQARMVLILSLSAMLASGLVPSVAAASPADASLVLMALREAAVGAAMAFGLFTAFAAFQFAGKLLDVQIGFGLGAVFDPATRAQSSLLGGAFNTLALVLFFLANGHHMMLRAVAYSLQKVPPGQWPAGWGPQIFLDQFGVMFVLGLTLVAPVMLALLLVDFGLGVVSRTMPQLNVFTVGIPAKIVVGMLVLLATLAPMAAVIERMFNTLFRFWQQLMV